MTPCRYCGTPDAYDSGHHVECVAPKCGHWSAKWAAEVLSRRAAPPALSAPQVPTSGPFREDGMILRPVGAAAVVPRPASGGMQDPAGPHAYQDTESVEPCECGHLRGRHALVGDERAGFCLSRRPWEETDQPCDCEEFRAGVPEVPELDLRGAARSRPPCCPSHAAREVLASDRALVRGGEEVTLQVLPFVNFRIDYAALHPVSSLEHLRVLDLRVGCDSAFAMNWALPGDCFHPVRPFRMPGSVGAALRRLGAGMHAQARVQNVSAFSLYAQLCFHGERERFRDYGGLMNRGLERYR